LTVYQLTQPKNLHWKTEDEQRDTASFRRLTRINRSAKYKVRIAVIDSTLPRQPEPSRLRHFGDGSSPIAISVR